MTTKKEKCEELPVVFVEEEVIENAKSTRISITVSDKKSKDAFDTLVKIKKEFRE